ncbi:DNA alkylation repair protein [Paenarthrobacter sp. NPDC089675]|uniref:DNA alkylation repair protein n=1 Tax=Paenarthrobacter sp. NPDC089675 TaxID=3364376 RepID=UPI003820C09E
MNSSQLVEAVRSALHSAADAERGRGAQAYMKSSMPSLGVRVPEVRRIAKAACRQFPPGSADQLRRDALDLWRNAAVREERYAAIDLTAAPMVKADPGMLPVYEEIIRTGAWWDLVDGVAHRIGALLLALPEIMTPVLLQWSTDPDMWIRRSSITAQLGAKARTDTALLAAVIKANLADKEFFIRKAIGWALREYSKTDAVWVAAFAAENAAGLSPLSTREALRLLPALSPGGKGSDDGA